MGGYPQLGQPQAHMDPVLTELKDKHDNFVKTYRQQVDETRLLIQSFYLTERAQLLECLVKIVSASERDTP